MEPLSIDNLINVARTFEARNNHRLSAFKMSAETLDALIEQVPLIAETRSSQAIYGIPVITDESVPLGQFRIVLPKT